MPGKWISDIRKASKALTMLPAFAPKSPSSSPWSLSPFILASSSGRPPGPWQYNWAQNPCITHSWDQLPSPSYRVPVREPPSVANRS